jgi:hypothetical protein
MRGLHLWLFAVRLRGSLPRVQTLLRWPLSLEELDEFRELPDKVLVLRPGLPPGTQFVR